MDKINIKTLNVLLVIPFALALFYLDLKIELGAANGVLYVFIILATFLFFNSYRILWVGIFCTFLVLLGYYFSPLGGETWKVLLNRFYTLLAIWVAVYGFYLASKKEKALAQSLAEQENQKPQIFLASIIDSTDDAVIGKSLTGEILSWNKGAERTYGYSSDEIIGQNISALIPDDRKSERDDFLSKIVRGESIDHCETLRAKKDGTLINVSLAIAPIKNSKGDIVGASTIARDITEQGHARETESYLASIIDSTDNAVIGKSLTGEILSWNKGAEKTYGYSSDEIIGQNISILIPDDRKDEQDDFLAKIVKGETIDHYETLRAKKDGSLINVSLAIAPIKNSKGDIVGASTIARDITESKKLGAAEKANKAKSIFLANMSHEIRTPLNAILGYSQILLRNKSLDQSSRESIKTINTSGNNLLKLINEILDISKIEAGMIELNSIDFDLNELTNYISNLFKLRCQQKKLRWTVESLPCRILVHGDENKLRQILTNLLGNAVKFTESGEVTFSITALGDNHYRFDITDTGVGIPLESQSIIFNPFQQGEAGAEKGGTGLGLAISKEQLKLMGADLLLKSEVNEGTNFYFTIHLPPATLDIKTDNDDKKTVISLASGFMAKALIVDDVKENRDVLSKLLSVVGVEIIEAENGKEGVEKTKEHLPDIVFMDMRMPVMRGEEAVKLIQEEFGKDRIKIVAITASTFDQRRDHFLSLGCHDYISKPFKAEQIFNSLKELLDVKYIYEDSETSQASLGPLSEIDFSQFSLLEELHDQLSEAASLGRFSVIEDHIKGLSQLDADSKKLSECFKVMLGGYDMPAIARALEKTQKIKEK